jgi:aspartate/methionine/tyrosine aminotransferase
MKKTPINQQLVDQNIAKLRIDHVGQASIREIVALVNLVEEAGSEKFIRMEMGVPGLPPAQVGTEAEIEALQSGVASKYPMMDGIKPLKQEASRFIKLFMDVDVSPAGCIPTVGSMQGTYAALLVASNVDPKKDTALFIDPGFPVQKRQLGVLGMKYESFDIYDYRGDKLRAKLESYLEKGHISTFLYSTPNNPAWISFTEKELSIIGELAIKYDVVVLEDLAYFGMDFRQDFGQPGQGPYPATVARYTDNYVLLFSSSKVFSYAGQRIGAMLISDGLFNRSFEDLNVNFLTNQFGPAILQDAIYTSSAGTAHSPQAGLAAILKAANDGAYDFVSPLKEYGQRAAIMKKHFLDNGFYLVYDKDEDQDLADGFYFTIAFPGMTGEQLLGELLRYGISAITLDTTGSSRTEGLRICVSHTSLDRMDEVAKRLQLFGSEHK